MPYLMRYNTMQHRSEPHSRFEDWLHNLPSSGVHAMCSWELRGTKWTQIWPVKR